MSEYATAEEQYRFLNMSILSDVGYFRLHLTLLFKKIYIYYSNYLPLQVRHDFTNIITAGTLENRHGLKKNGLHLQYVILTFRLTANYLQL